MKTTTDNARLRSSIKLNLFFLLLLFSFKGNGQGLTSFFFDFSGVQNVSVDTNGINGRSHNASQKAKSQFGIGIKFMEMNVNRDLHLGMIFCYRQINTSNYLLHDQQNQPLYPKITAFECLGGVTYLPRKPLFQSEKLACHFTLSGYAGLQGLALGSNLSGGFMILSKTGLAGLTFEFVYRPVEYALPDAKYPPYFFKMDPSWSLRVALTFGKNLSYNTD